jgi:putative transposase
MLFRLKLLKLDDEHIIVGDEVVASKAGKETYGLDRFFSSIQQRVIPGLSFFTFSLVNVREERSYPLQITQIVRSDGEKAESRAKAEAKKAAKKMTEKRKPGRPKGSKNKVKQEIVLNPELLRIQSALKRLLETIGIILSLKYVVLDGHFGNYPSAFMVRRRGLHLISKMRSDAALYPAFDGEYPGSGRPAKYGKKLDVRKLDNDKVPESNFYESRKLRTEIYQGTVLQQRICLRLECGHHLENQLVHQAQAHVVLFSTDLEQDYEKIIKFYSLRFQIEFNFRDAKQYLGLEDL